MENKKRLIDANALRERMFHYYGCVNEQSSKEHYNGETLMNYEVADLIDDCIDNAPTVDAVEVVRCKDCKHWLPEEAERCKALKQEPYGLCNRYPQRTSWQDTTDQDDFCSYGERRSDA